MPSTNYNGPSLQQGTTADSNYTITFASTAMAYMASDMYMAVSSDPGMGWGDTDPIPYTPAPAPEEDFEFCIWCDAEWFPSEFYPGNCMACGGPRKFTYTRRTMA